ncbi:hypothetical protein P280DRAFT_127878 [Massarina eburnea CBS 473.64]|uniref:Uncharacterized protein n=1 Tax=Massarina eburnea CBS 473.64 TaxID=1395130 RepID=A0A6A6SG96_9PLEO|nr:hypothetical protein P280DRAFT_127878 [Massarina eburnea CBS 473.64]
MSSPSSVTHSTPPRLNTLALFPTIPKRVQWDILQSYFDEHLPDTAPPIDRTWLDNVDKSILLTLLAKKRSELDLLHSEAAYSSLYNRRSPKRYSGIKFPNYDVGIRSPSHTTPMQESQYQSAASQLHSISYRDHRNTTTELGVSKRYTQHDGNNRLLLPSPVSPLSPTFGPRRGLIPSGTTDRRRSSVPEAQAAKGVNNEAEGDRAATAMSSLALTVGVDEDTSRNREKRVLWEAAWKEIEGHFEEYVGRFGVGEGEGRDAEGKENLWGMLVELRNEKRNLEQL